MFCLYQTQEAGRQLFPRDFQFIQTPRVAFDNARIYYEMDYRRYERQDASVDLPQRKSANNDRFNPSDKYSGISGYDPIYNATECDLNRGRIIGIDTSERWDPFHHPFYFDADSNLVYGGSRGLRDSPFEQAVRRAYEECLKRHHGKKPAPTLKKHYIGDSGQQAPPGKMLNSKAAGRLLAAGGVYNGNVAGFRKTAEQLGGDAVKGYDQVLNEKTSGSMIAAASVLLAKTARNPLTRGELSSSLVENKTLGNCSPIICKASIPSLSGGGGLAGSAVGVGLGVAIAGARNGDKEPESGPNVGKDLTDEEKAELGGTGSGIPSPNGDNNSNEDGDFNTSDQRSIRSLEEQIKEHEAKLEAYKKDPDLFDNKGYLKNAPSQEVRQRIIDGRIRHLENEIKTFNKNINKIKNKKG